MKVIITLYLSLLFYFTALAQNPAVIDFMVKEEFQIPGSRRHRFSKSAPIIQKHFETGQDETLIGISYYDLQSYGSLGNRVYRYPDESIGATWTMGMMPAGFQDRGTGYNYFDGVAWGNIPETRIEEIRSGWPSYSPWDVNGEIIVSDADGQGVILFNRINKGTGEWVETILEGPPGSPDIGFPRVITSGTNHEVIHLFVNSNQEYQNQERALLYARSSDGGMTWDPAFVVLNGTGSENYHAIYPDTYVLAAKESSVAILVASAWHDLFIMRSDDNGESWDKYIVWDHPYPFFNWNTTITDTFFCVDNSASIEINENGEMHIVFGISNVAHLQPGNEFYINPYCDGIGYWNQDMEPFSNHLHALAPPYYNLPNSEMVKDYNYIAWSMWEPVIPPDPVLIYPQMGFSSMPSIYIEEVSNDITVLYSTCTDVNQNQNDTLHKNIWGRIFNMDQWGPIFPLNPEIIHIFDECIYPQIIHTQYSPSGKEIQFIFQADCCIGLACLGQQPWIENHILYKGSYFVNIDDFQPISEIMVKNYPNPFDNFTIFNIYIIVPGKLFLKLFNPLGQLVREVTISISEQGWNQFRLNAKGLEQGYYYYNITLNNKTASGKLIIL